MKKDEIIRLFRDVSIFNSFDPAWLKKIIPLLTPIRCGPGTTLITEGEPGESMFLIKSGRVDITKTLGSNEVIMIGSLGPGAYFGELSLIDNLPRSASVVTAEDSEIYELSKSDFDRLLTDNGDIAIAFYKNCLNETFSRFRSNVASYTFSQHNLRVASEQLAEINRDLSFAHKIQSYFITSHGSDSTQMIGDTARYSFVYDPCREVGGDFFNISKISEHCYGIIIADVEGHGVTASLATGILKSAFSLLASSHSDDPVELVTRLNRHFGEVLSRKLFATAYYMVIDTQESTMQFVKAGHPHPLIWKHGARDFIPVNIKGPGLGIIHNAEYHVMKLQYEPGDKMLLFTAGTIEQMNPGGEMYELERLTELFASLIRENVADPVQRLHLDILRFAAGAPITDDITLLCIEF
jgi:serine phosphatase RsbU (regulator of sigma subunit)